MWVRSGIQALNTFNNSVGIAFSGEERKGRKKEERKGRRRRKGRKRKKEEEKEGEKKREEGEEEEGKEERRRKKKKKFILLWNLNYFSPKLLICFLSQLASESGRKRNRSSTDMGVRTPEFCSLQCHYLSYFYWIKFSDKFLNFHMSFLYVYIKWRRQEKQTILNVF